MTKKLLSPFVLSSSSLLLLCGLLGCPNELTPLSEPVTGLKTGREHEPDLPMKINYAELFYSSQVNAQTIPKAETIVYAIKSHQARYFEVENETKIPWFVVATIHSMEASLNFNCHLHNGDPLTARTIHVPSRRPVKMPKSGNFPYTWEESALDALTCSELWMPKKWSLANCLEFLERYNGLGYAYKGLNTPYLWSGTNLYTKGLFVSDNKFDSEAVSRQIGGVTLLKIMILKGYVQLIKGDFL